MKDEVGHIALTAQSMIQQTLRPLRWIIVDDGSTDGTSEILRAYEEEHDFIRVVSRRHGGARQTGSAEVHAFYCGHAALGALAYRFIVKLDGDLSFQPDYFEVLLSRFAEKPRLGIASGVYQEQDATGVWSTVPMPTYHAFGACKVIRRECFEEIGGLAARPGWDTADQIRASGAGWETRHFEDLVVKHHKPEGTGMGLLRTSAMHGEVLYVTARDPTFLILKVLHRMSKRPLLLNGVALLAGYCAAAIRRRPMLVNKSERRLYRAQLWQRVWAPSTRRNGGTE